MRWMSYHVGGPPLPKTKDLGKGTSLVEKADECLGWHTYEGSLGLCLGTGQGGREGRRQSYGLPQYAMTSEPPKTVGWWPVLNGVGVYNLALSLENVLGKVK